VDRYAAGARWLFRERVTIATRLAVDETILSAAICSHRYEGPSFSIDLIRVVHFLINPVRCNGGVINLNHRANSYRFRADDSPLGAADSGDRSGLTANNWRLPSPPERQSQQPQSAGRRFFDSRGADT
jgi:hypothetical protein